MRYQGLSIPNVSYRDKRAPPGRRNAGSSAYYGVQEGDDLFGEVVTTACEGYRDELPDCLFVLATTRAVLGEQGRLIGAETMEIEPCELGRFHDPLVLLLLCPEAVPSRQE